MTWALHGCDPVTQQMEVDVSASTSPRPCPSETSETKKRAATSARIRGQTPEQRWVLISRGAERPRGTPPKALLLKILPLHEGTRKLGGENKLDWLHNIH